MSGPSILIVDDDDVFRSRLARAFEERGYEVRASGDVGAALAEAERDSPELAVVDLRLPEGSGLTVLQRLLALDPGTKVVVLTGYGSVTTAVEAIRLGAVDYLQKPAHAADIIQALERKAEVHGLAPLPSTSAGTPSLARAEWEYLHRVLADAAGNVSEAARRLKIHRRSLQRKLQKRPPNA